MSRHRGDESRVVGIHAPYSKLVLAPPKLASAPERLREIAAEQVARIQMLAPDGLVVYDIQDELGPGAR